LLQYGGWLTLPKRRRSLIEFERQTAAALAVTMITVNNL
jgi:hypothetical protein